MQANAKFVQKGECWTLGIRVSLEAWVQYSLGVTFAYWNFLFSGNKASDANIGIIANFMSFEKPRVVDFGMNYLLNCLNIPSSL